MDNCLLVIDFLYDKYPKIITNTNAIYFNGETSETSDNLND